jgi:hypothetical protein
MVRSAFLPSPPASERSPFRVRKDGVYANSQ